MATAHLVNDVLQVQREAEQSIACVGIVPNASAAISTLAGAYTWPVSGARPTRDLSRMFDGLGVTADSVRVATSAKERMAYMSAGESLSDLYVTPKLHRLTKELAGRLRLASPTFGFDLAKWETDIRSIEAWRGASDTTSPSGDCRGASAEALAADVQLDSVLVGQEDGDRADADSLLFLDWLRRIPVSERHNLVSYLLTLLSPATAGLNATGLIEVPEPATSAAIAIIAIVGISFVVARSLDN
jgi:hypothetical protein